MLKVSVKEQENQVEFSDKELTSGLLNGKQFNWDVQKIKEDSYHLIKDGKAYSVEVLDADYSKKKITLKVNNAKYELAVKDKFDVLLHNLGMDDLLSAKVSAIEAPMPGLVLETKVKPGDEVKEGDVLVVLEAMKMENNIKSPCDGVIKSVPIAHGTAVEKKEILIEFE